MCKGEALRPQAGSLQWEAVVHLSSALPLQSKHVRWPTNQATGTVFFFFLLETDTFNKAKMDKASVFHIAA